MKYFKQTKKQKGTALIITFFVMVIVLGIDIFISSILYSEIKIIRNIGNSVASFYAAESGIEKVLYFNRKVLPDFGEENDQGNIDIINARGFCFMCHSANPEACSEDPGGISGDKSIYCNNCNTFPGDVELQGCDPFSCNNCQVTFETSLDDKRRYKLTASIRPSTASDDLLFKIESIGYYKEYILRAIEININVNE